MDRFSNGRQKDIDFKFKIPKKRRHQINQKIEEMKRAKMEEREREKARQEEKEKVEKLLKEEQKRAERRFRADEFVGDQLWNFLGIQK